MTTRPSVRLGMVYSAVRRVLRDGTLDVYTAWEIGPDAVIVRNSFGRTPRWQFFFAPRSWLPKYRERPDPMDGAYLNHQCTPLEKDGKRRRVGLIDSEHFRLPPRDELEFFSYLKRLMDPMGDVSWHLNPRKLELAQASRKQPTRDRSCTQYLRYAEH